ncbi:MAG TPA: diphthine synthase [Candidatus Pacearchaeota archaeon]|nr:diphthine synthase [Candidatus Pacearchaeota archaeon]
MFYLIGLGLNVDEISKRALEILKKCDFIYLEGYTVDFPYTQKDLEKVIGKKIEMKNRDSVEDLNLIKQAKTDDIALLVYGSPLSATTHITLIEEAKKQKCKYEIFHNASIIDAIAETGLQVYKFGKITSMPAWIPEKSFKPTSFMEILKQNLSIKAHTLVLIDIGLDLNKALAQLEESAKQHKIKLEKIAVCSQLGTPNRKIIYRTLEQLKKIKEIAKPYCIIIPGELHFVEKEFLEGFS